jgi:hypothetical protein
LQVTFSDVNGAANLATFVSKAVDIPFDAKTLRSSDLQINQAIKLAINSDDVLNKLLVAEDGPGSTLVVRSLSDGQHVVGDLAVAFIHPEDATGGDPRAYVLTSSDVAAYKAAFFPSATAVTAADVEAAVTAYIALVTASTDYASQFARANGVDIAGAHSAHTSDNQINSGPGNDVIVLSTGAYSNDTIVYTGFENGFDTIVNFHDAADTGVITTAGVVTISLGSLNALATFDFGSVSLAAGDAENLGEIITGLTGAYAGWTPAIAVGTGVDVAGIITLTWSGGTPAQFNAVAGLLSASAAGGANAASVFTDGSSSTDEGHDLLDFLSYGAVAVYLDNSNDATATTSPGLNPIDSVTNLGALAGPNGLGALTETATAVPVGRKYITIEQLDTTGTATGKLGQYIIKLWQDQAGDGTGANGHGVVEIDQTVATHDTLLGIIGTVDFGGQLDPTWFDGTTVLV